MTQDELASLSFAELRDRLKARIEELDHADDIDLIGGAALSEALPDEEHTPDSVRCLSSTRQKFFLRSTTRWRRYRRHRLRRTVATALGQSYCCVDARGV